MNHSATPRGNTEQNALLLDIATRNVVSFGLDACSREAAQVMAERRISSVVITDNAGHPAGIVTERNILHVMQSGLEPETLLRDIMSSPLISVPASITVADAYQLCLQRNIRHLVIVDEKGLPAGVASETDFRQHINLTALTGRRKISAIAKRAAIALPPAAKLSLALSLMLAQSKSCVIVVDRRKPVGIITERDVVRLYSDAIASDDISLEEVMITPLLTVPNDASTSQAAELMLSRKLRHLVAVDESGCMTGLISEHDLTQAMVNGLTEERSGIEENFLHTLVNALPDLIWLKDKEGVYLTCNARFERFFGATEQDIVGKSDYAFLSRELADSFQEYDRKAIEQDSPSINEEWVTFAEDGHCELLETIKTPMRDRNGKLVGVLGIARDITGRRQLEESLERSERKLRDIYDSVGDCIEIISTDGRILDMNRAGYERLGYTREEMIGKKLTDFTAPEFAGRVAERMALIKRQGYAAFESERLCKDGAAMPLEVRSRLIELDGQEVFIGISRDITLRKQTELALRQALELSESVINAIPDLLFELDRNGKYLNVWAHDPALLATQKERLLGRTIGEMLSDEATGIAMSALAEADEKGESRGQILRLDLPHGESWFELSTVVKPAADASPRHFIMLSRDVTKRVRAEAALRASEEKLRSLYELSSMGIALTDMQGRYLEFNDAFRNICGYTREELNNLDYWALTPKEYADEEAEQLESLKKNGRYGPYEKEYIRKDGSRIPLRMNGLLIRDHEGAPFIWSIVENITERKRAEDALREKEERLALATLHNCVGIWDWNLVTREMIWDDSMYALYRIRREDFSGTEEAWRAALHPDDQERGDREVEAAIRGEKSFDTEFRVVWPDGKIRHIKAMAKVFCDDQSTPSRMLGTNVDITDLKLMEAALTESERRYRNLVENSPFCIHEIDLEGRLQSMNRAGLCMLGLDDEKKIRGLPYLEAVGEQDSTRIRQLMQDAVNGKARHCEFTGAGNSPRYFKSCFIPIHDSAGRVIKLMGITEDFTERKRAENALREREEIFSSIVNQAADSILLIDAETMSFAEFNRMAHESLGYTRDEFAALTLADVQAQYSPEQLRRILDDASASGNPVLIETQHRRKDGTIRITQVGSRAIVIHGKNYFSSIWSDITQRKEAELKLQQSEAHFRFVTESAQALIWMSGADRLCTWFNKVWLDFTGRTLEQELGDGWAQGVHPDDLQACFEIYSSHFERREPFSMEYRLKRHDGEYRWIVDDGSPRFNARGVFEGYIGSCFDITERKRNEENLRITASVFETTQEAILITDANNLITDVNQSFSRITGYSRDEVLGCDPRFLSSGRHDRSFYAEMWQTIAEQKSWRGEIWNRRKTGESYAELLSISAICDEDDKVQRYVGVFSDISYLKEHEAELSRAAHYDALTGIPNRVLLADRMKQAIAQTSRERQTMAVCYLDLDGFKTINDTQGHDAGDLALIEMAQRIGSTIRGGDTVARLGGDEFVVLLLGLERGDECMATLERLLDAISQPMEIKGKPVTLGASIGVSIYPLDDEDPDTLLRHADQAMYVSKQSGKNRYNIYDPALDIRVRNHHEFVRGIRDALERGQFELYYQPKINLKSGELVGAEALIRWHHAERGLLTPAEFLPAIENSGLCIEIGEWVIVNALEQIGRWRNDGLNIELSINISAYHLESPYFAENLRQHLARHPGLAPESFQIEVLETAAFKDVAVVRGVIEGCRKLGVRFALDDFGTGYSSLSYLSSLPVDVLKIDQSFVRNILDNSGDRAIVQGVIALAHTFNREIVAEGIETCEHHRALLDMGCELGQGYCIARPMPADRLLTWKFRP